MDKADPRQKSTENEVLYNNTTQLNMSSQTQRELPLKIQYIWREEREREMKLSHQGDSMTYKIIELEDAAAPADIFNFNKVRMVELRLNLMAWKGEHGGWYGDKGGRQGMIYRGRGRTMYREGRGVKSVRSVVGVLE